MKSKEVFVVLLMFSSGLLIVNVPVKAQEPYVKVYVYQPLGYIPGVPIDGKVKVDIIIELSGFPLHGPGVVGWGMDVQVDPNVIDINMANGKANIIGAKWGYFLYMFAWDNGLPPPILDPGIPDPITGYWNGIAEMLPVPDGGAGEFYSGLKLVTIEFTSKSETAYSPINLENVEYMTADGAWHPVDEVVDGQYNQQIHDVAATGVTIFDYVPINATYNSSVVLTYINGTVENQGTLSETFNVSIYYKLAGQDELLTLETVTLTPGSSAVVTAVLNITDLGTQTPTGVIPVGYLTIIVEASEVANETDTSDNTFITQLLIKIPGDVNGDGCVDRRDFGLLAYHYATWFDHMPRFDDQCDFNRDGRVDRYDFGILAWYYGTCTVYQVL